MSGTWKATVGKTQISINTDALSAELSRIGAGPLDALAAAGAATARSRLSPADQRFIGTKSSKEFPLKSGKIPELSRRLEVPVALITNDSLWAASLEWGSSRKHPRRPLSSAFEALSRRVAMAVRGA